MRRSRLRRRAIRQCWKEAPATASRSPLAPDLERRRKADDFERLLEDEWKRDLQKGRCARCGLDCAGLRARRDPYPRLEGHHILPKQAIRRYATEHQLDSARLLWDLRNRLVLCRFCHSRHESAFDRLPASIIPTDAWEFADALGLRWKLEQLYT